MEGLDVECKVIGLKDELIVACGDETDGIGGG